MEAQRAEKKADSYWVLKVGANYFRFYGLKGERDSLRIQQLLKQDIVEKDQRLRFLSEEELFKLALLQSHPDLQKQFKTLVIKEKQWAEEEFWSVFQGVEIEVART